MIAERGDVRAFLAVLEELRGGEVLVELAEGWTTLLDAVHLNDRKGKLTLTLVVEPSAVREKAVIIADNVVVSAPRPRRETTLGPEDLEPRLPLADSEEDPDFRTRAAGPDP